MTWQFILTGLLIGALVGLTGMGGGSLMTPILILLFGFKPTLAVGTDILHGAIFKTVGAVRHRRLGTVHAQLAVWMFLGSAPMSLLGVQLGDYLENAYGDGRERRPRAGPRRRAALRRARARRQDLRPRRRAVRRRAVPGLRRDRIVAVAIGASGGFIVGLTSVGSGTFFGLMMLFVFPLTAAKIVGTDILHAAALL